MALSGILFVVWRIIELIFLIPPLGMLSAIVHGFINNNELTPNFILVLFIVVVLASVWVLLTLLLYGKARHAGFFVALIDLGFFGALIAGVALLAPITKQSCTNFNPESYIGISLGPFAYDLENACNLLKASFAFGIMEIILFFFTFILALLVGRHWSRRDQEEDEKSYSRRTHRRHTSRSGGGGSRSGGSRVGGDGRRDYRDDRSRRGTSQRAYSRQRSNV